MDPTSIESPNLAPLLTPPVTIVNIISLSAVVKLIIKTIVCLSLYSVPFEAGGGFESSTPWYGFGRWAPYNLHPGFLSLVVEA